MSDRDALAEVLSRHEYAPGWSRIPYRFYAEADAILASDWLAGVKAEAWDEGHRWTGYEPYPRENPHRATPEPASKETP